MRDKALKFHSKLDYLADAGTGLSTLHAFGGAHGQFGLEHTVLHNGHGLLKNCSLEAPIITPESLTILGGKYPAPEILKARETGDTTKIDPQKVDVFSLGIEILHLTIDRTLPNVSGLIDNSSHKFPSAPTKRNVSVFMKQLRNLEERLKRPCSTELETQIRTQLSELIHDCTRQDPQKRISMEEATMRLRDIVEDHAEKPA